MTIYADILFLVNLSLNWFSLILTSKMMKLKSNVKKMLLAAAAGAAAGVLTIFFPKTVPVAITEIASAFLMCAIAFKAEGFFKYIKICTCLFASGVTIGGSLTLIYSFFNRSGIRLQKQSDLSTAIFLLLSFTVTVTAVFFERFIRSSKSAESGLLTLEYGGKSMSMPYFCDSGNFLLEPISGKPAIIINERELLGFLPRELLEFDPLTLGADNTLPHSGIRLLPASTVCGSGIMLGIIPDKVTLTDKKGSKEVDAIIALDRTRGESRRAKAIVPTSLI